LTVLGVNILPSHVFTTWQAVHCHPYFYLASNACLYDLVLGKQGLHIQVLQIGKQGPDSCLLLCKQCTDPDLRQFLHQARWEHIPNPEITLRVSCAFLQNA